MSPRHQDKLFALSLHLAAVAVVLCLFGVSPALGQNTYSDSWLDNAGAGTIAGCGVTDGSYTHSYYVDTTLRSSNDRTNSRSSGRHMGYARADISLSWDWNDTNDYFTDSDHYARCPGDDLNYYFIGLTQSILKINKHAYEYDSFTVDEYIPTCTGRCTISPRMRNELLAPARYIQCYSDGGCNTSFCSIIPTKGTCSY